jgi:hypothetical protein
MRSSWSSSRARRWTHGFGARRRGLARRDCPSTTRWRSRGRLPTRSTRPTKTHRPSGSQARERQDHVRRHRDTIRTLNGVFARLVDGMPLMRPRPPRQHSSRTLRVSELVACTSGTSSFSRRRVSSYRQASTRALLATLESHGRRAVRLVGCAGAVPAPEVFVSARDQPLTRPVSSTSSPNMCRLPRRPVPLSQQSAFHPTCYDIPVR